MWRCAVACGAHDPAVDDYQLEYTVSICAYYVPGQHPLGYSCAKALLLHSANQGRRAQTMQNLVYYGAQVVRDPAAHELFECVDAHLKLPSTSQSLAAALMPIWEFLRAARLPLYGNKLLRAR